MSTQPPPTTDSSESTNGSTVEFDLTRRNSEQQLRLLEFYPASAQHYKLLVQTKQNNVSTEWSAMYIQRGTMVTIKIQKLNTHDAGNVMAKIHVLANLSHANIRKIHAVFVVEDSVWMVMPHEVPEQQCLQVLLESRCKQGMSKRLVSAICKGMLLGLSYLHANNVVHGNIELDNVYVDVNSGDVFLGLADTENRTASSDFYQLGVVVLKLVKGYASTKCTNLHYQHLEQDIQAQIVDEDLQELISTCLQQARRHDIVASSLLELALFQPVVDYHSIVLRELKRQCQRRVSIQWEDELSGCSQDGCPSSGSSHHHDTEQNGVFRSDFEKGFNFYDIASSEVSRALTRSISQPDHLFAKSCSLQRSSSTASATSPKPKSCRSFRLGRFTVTDDDDDNIDNECISEVVQRQVGRFKLVKENVRQNNEEDGKDKKKKVQKKDSSMQILQTAMHQLVEIQEAQRTLADSFSVLLTAIGDAQRGRTDKLQQITQGNFVRVVQYQQLQEQERMRERIRWLESHNSYLQEENQRLRCVCQRGQLGHDDNPQF